MGDKTEKLAGAGHALGGGHGSGHSPAKDCTSALLGDRAALSVGAASAKELCYFTGASSATIKSLAKSGILTLEQQEVFRRVS